MADGRRAPGIATLFGVLLLVGSVGGTAWYYNRTKLAPVPLPDPATLDVYCSGRVDTSKPVTALDPSTMGRVTAIFIAEGATVKAGQKLLQLDDEIALARQAQAKAAVDAAQVDVDSATLDKTRFPTQIAARKALVDAAAARVESAKKLLEQRREQKQVTPLGKAEQEAMEAQIHEIELLELAERTQLDDLKKIDMDLRIRAATARLKGAKADEQLAAKAVAECLIAAPSDGIVLRLSAAVGGLVGPGSPVPPVVFAPAGPLVVRAEVDQDSLGKVKEGLAVEVRDENRTDGPVWKGRLVKLARWVAGRRTLVLEPGELNDVRTVECLVELDSPAADLWIGQRMRVRILRGN